MGLPFDLETSIAIACAACAGLILFVLAYTVTEGATARRFKRRLAGVRDRAQGVVSVETVAARSLARQQSATPKIDRIARQWQFASLPSMAAVLLGFYAPRIYLRNTADKRAKQLQLGLPDGLDLMVICAEAGLSLDATLVRVSRELGNTWPELAEEFGITAAELTFLPERRMAFDNLNARTDSDGIRGVVNTLQQTAKFGTPLAQSLRVLATEMRNARMTR